MSTLGSSALFSGNYFRKLIFPKKKKIPKNFRKVEFLKKHRKKRRIPSGYFQVGYLESIEWRPWFNQTPDHLVVDMEVEICDFLSQPVSILTQRFKLVMRAKVKQRIIFESRVGILIELVF